MCFCLSIELSLVPHIFPHEFQFSFYFEYSNILEINTVGVKLEFQMLRKNKTVYNVYLPSAACFHHTIGYGAHEEWFRFFGHCLKLAINVGCLFMTFGLHSLLIMRRKKFKGRRVLTNILESNLK